MCTLVLLNAALARGGIELKRHRGKQSSRSAVEDHAHGPRTGPHRSSSALVGIELSAAMELSAVGQCHREPFRSAVGVVMVHSGYSPCVPNQLHNTTSSSAFERRLENRSSCQLQGPMMREGLHEIGRL